ncbi:MULTISPECIES: nitrile hydratase subunit beta [unclassified Brenneria]|uniref:nitrile hydratase subunit beta n=1 Tax=unclassified Brenneria TaxID=2634434 RepID=UPI00155719AA|nr:MULTISPECIES: nitrile hydratase subunit beta [unclassified Brenneria]MBJ7220806.1 nitrile hydratase subunit beta [Brenneria sp. L3-3C-1]MEE3642046.1 nitrile hydratase subunit beta [Brenneria sp. L3_3C_1]MEE3649257.1 nitrile hydratase subunit beta [Brenneria sp. HEZEL_4_2_4]NPC99210.1 nitrile hydratase subunit beta [Brenneria sp. hezel4-2-4]
MNGVHDIGGMDGMGPVGPTKWEPVYHAPWEKAAYALFPFAARAGMFGLDEFRCHLEKLHPLHYLTAFYYEHWVDATEQIGEKKGYWTQDELDKRTEYYLQYPEVPLPPNNDPELVQFAEWAVRNGFSTARQLDTEPKFKIGDRVTVDASVPKLHTRRAGYVRGRTGEIIMCHGAHVYPDTTGNGLPETSEHLYTLRFTNEELYGAEAAEPNGAVCTDAWEPYLTLAK